MSFERNAASAERSLMDIFGPDASDDAKAITERAAQLSMSDMANILNAKTSSKNVLAVDINNHFHDVQWKAQISRTHQIAEAWEHPVGIVLQQSAHTAMSFLQITEALEQLSVPHKPLDDYCAFLSKQYDKLLDGRVDLDSVTISLKYENPVTGKMATETYASKNSKRIELTHSRKQPNVYGKRSRKPFVKS
ncbi:hypothetical protein H4F33_06370 [Pectobacterium brasiliense]|uniref:hypothetical protein n=1 Tax=Pectobacterium brasiliense TaxID=180957 RepID=UPI0015DF2791|nr:hypothetical protein [Pectobacterium brasiliense]MBA0217439.1 hypothetical protein [Pectobacterium brasiliense]MBN3071742.1 hypothetical protein [Pectobacterium brasiliense]MBN3168599.1 hypothetical protein [Pectobacterium brasiliense]